MGGLCRQLRDLGGGGGCGLVGGSEPRGDPEVRSRVGVLAGEGRGHLPHQSWLFDGQQMMSASPWSPLSRILGRSREGCVSWGGLGPL